jgi:PAS domain S-box-containing protein
MDQSAEAALRRAARQEHRELIDSIEGIVWEADAGTWRFTFVSRWAEQLLGYPVSRWMEEPDFWARHLHPEDRGWAVEFCRTTTDSGRDHELEYRMVAADGRVVWVRDLVKVIAGEGQAPRLRGVMVDVTRRKEAEAEVQLNLALQRLRNQILQMQGEEDWPPLVKALHAEMGALMRFRGSSVALLDRQKGSTHVYYMDGAEVHLFVSYELAEPIRRAVEEGRPLYRRSRAELLARGEARVVEAGVGSVVDYPFAQGTLAISSEAEEAFGERDLELLGRFAQLLAEPQLLLEQKQRLKLREEQLYQGQKLEAIGTLVSGIAHDFNNLLTPILGGIQMARRQVPAPAAALLDDAEEAALRAAALVKQLLSFARQDRAVFQPITLVPLLRELARLLRQTIDRRVQLDFHVPADLWPVTADSTRVHQMVMNLCLNARDALEDYLHGRVERPASSRGEALKVFILAGNVALGPEAAALHPEARPGEFVRLRIEDNGPGMAPQVQERIFDPFFTTKEKGRGTGLGLATAYGVVKQCQGWIAVQSAPGEGSCFEVYLPRAREAPAAEAAALARPGGGTETILVVEDEEGIRRLMRACLEQAGYTVQTARDGAEALEMLTGPAAAAIDLVLLDLNLPERSGREVLAEMRSRAWARPVIVFSGQLTPEIEAGLRPLGVSGFLAKPFRIEEAEQMVREVLDAGGDQPSPPGA